MSCDLRILPKLKKRGNDCEHVFFLASKSPLSRHRVIHLCKTMIVEMLSSHRSIITVSLLSTILMIYALVKRIPCLQT